MFYEPILAYVGPNVVLPITSAIAALVAFFLTVGRSGITFLLSGFRNRTDSVAPQDSRDP